MGVGSVALAQAVDPDGDGDQDATPHHAKSDKTTGVSEVVVKGIRSLVGDKVGLPLKEAPQSINVLSKQLLEDQSVTRLEDALKNVPGVTLNAGEGSARGDTINIRGFSAYNDFFLDGIRDAAIYVRDPFNLESIEVLKGPSATLFGRGSTGGAVNQVSKAPVLQQFGVLNADVGANHEYRGTVDLNMPINDTTAVRLNAMGESSGVADRDYVHASHWGVAPEVAFGLGTATTVTVAYYHLSENDVPDSGVPLVNGAPPDVKRSNFYGLSSDRAISYVDIGTLRIRHDFDSNLSVSNTLRYANYDFDYQFDAPNYGATPPGLHTPLSAILVGRDAPDSSGTQTNLTEQFDATYHFKTGFLTHTLMAGIELSRQTSHLDGYNNPFNKTNNWIAEVSLLDPNPNEVKPPQPVTKTQITTADAEAAYLTDTVNIGSQIDLIAGVRVDRFAADYVQHALTTGVATPLNHTDVVASPRVALVYKPLNWQSFYFSYGTSFDPSAEALILSTKNADLAPTTAKTYEFGSKSSLLNGSLLVTGAIFQTEVDNAQVTDPESTNLISAGNETVRGFELGATGHIGPKIEITAGYTYLDGKTSGAPGAAPSNAYNNVAMPNVAHNAANIWAEYYITNPWEVGLGVNYLGARVGNIVTLANPISHIPSYVVWSGMTSYRVNSKLTLQFNVINLFDARYYDNVYYTSVSENHVIPGAGRTFKLTARASF